MFRRFSHSPKLATVVMLLSVLPCLSDSRATPSALWRHMELPVNGAHHGSLAVLGERAAVSLEAANQRVCCFESTTGGLVQAALLAYPGSSAFTSCGAVTYTSSRSVGVLGPSARPLGEPLDAAGHRCRPTNGAEYVASKQERTQALARRKRIEVGTTWCICENGACGPTFAYPDVEVGFTTIFVSGPVERGLVVRSTHARREQNMWGFTRAALDLLAECVAEAAAASLESAQLPPLLEVEEDRYGGVQVGVRPGAPWELSGFVSKLHASLEEWQAAGKQGVWLTLPLEAHTYVSAAVEAGFVYHHATASRLVLTRWLPSTPSPLPRYAFTTIGVGGVVVNVRGEVLMVQERVSPSPRMQGAWKLPGGLADPGEDFAATVAREVREETGVLTELDGVVSLRHAHGRRFGQGDVYVVVRLRATEGHDRIVMDALELRDARWMSSDEIDSCRELPDDSGQPLAGKVSKGNWQMIRNALDGQLIEGLAIPSSKGEPTLLYRAPPATPTATAETERREP